MDISPSSSCSVNSFDPTLIGSSDPPSPPHAAASNVRARNPIRNLLSCFVGPCVDTLFSFSLFGFLFPRRHQRAGGESHASVISPTQSTLVASRAVVSPPV